MDPKEIKTDKFGWKYYDHLPDGFRIGDLEDFHIKGRKKVGMEYLIQRADQPHFEIHHIQVETRATSLIPFIDCEMVFVRTR